MHDDVEFADFVHATGTQLFRTALLLCGDHHLAEDLTQTTYAKVFAKWPKVRRADSPAAYARTMLLNTFLSHRRLRRSVGSRTGTCRTSPPSTSWLTWHRYEVRRRARPVAAAAVGDR